MNRILTLTSILIFAFSLLPSQLHAAGSTYYVTQKGNGERKGQNPQNALAVSDFNALTGSYQGDTFFFSGNFSSEIRPRIYGADEKHVILDGYETDDITYKNLSEASGRAKIDTNRNGNGIDIKDHDFITIQDFEITDCDSQGIAVYGTSNDIIIKRTYIHEMIQGISVSGSGTYNVTIGGTRNHGNVLKNLGTGTAHEDIALWSGAHDIIVSYNHLYADDTNWGIDGVLITTGANEVLVEYNSIHDHNHDDGVDDRGEDGVDIKKSNTHDIIVRFNNIYGHADTPNRSQAGMRAQSGADKVYVYGNRFYRNQVNFETGDDQDTNDQIYFFSNIVDNGETHGIIIGSQGDSYDTWVFNNTVIANGTCTEKNGVDECQSFSSNTNWGNLRVYAVENSTTIINNIFYKSRPNDDNYQQFYVHKNSDTRTTTDANIYYWPSKTSKIYWGNSGLLTLAQVKAGSNGLRQEDDISKPGIERDPGLSNIARGDYTIASASSAVVDAGVDMGSGNIATLTIQGDSYPVPWDFALGPNTDWSGTIPVIEVLRRDVVGWDIGAYVYKEMEDTEEKKKPGQAPDQEPDLEPITDTQAPQPPNAFHSES